MQGHAFLVDFHIIPWMTDLVLGAKWLIEMGPMWWDFNSKELSFKYQDKDIKLKGLRTLETTFISGQSVPRIMKQARVASILQLMEPQEKHVNHVLDQKQQSQLVALLKNYSEMFRTPSGIPTSRDLITSYSNLELPH